MEKMIRIIENKNYKKLVVTDPTIKDCSLTIEIETLFTENMSIEKIKSIKFENNSNTDTDYLGNIIISDIRNDDSVNKFAYLLKTYFVNSE